MCEKEFGKNGDLKRHVDTIHLQLKPFKCNYEDCLKTFASKHDLKVHVNV